MAFFGCTDDKTGGSKEDAPVSIEFVELVGPAHRHKARVRYINNSEKDVRSVRSTLRFLDEEGKTIKETPWSQTDTLLVAADEKSEHDVGTYVPETTVDVKAEISLVVFADDEIWTRAKTQQPQAE